MYNKRRQTSNNDTKKICPHRPLRINQIRIVLNRVLYTGAYLRPSKQQASLRACDLARSHKSVGVGHRFGKVSVLAIMPSQIYSEKLEWTSNADRLKFNGRLVQIHFNLIGRDIVAFLRS